MVNNANTNLKSQLKSPTIQLNSSLKPAEPVYSTKLVPPTKLVSKPSNNNPLSPTMSTCKLQQPQENSCNNQSLTTFQSNNIARITPYSMNKPSALNEMSTDTLKIDHETISNSSNNTTSNTSTANLSANVIKMQQNFKEGMQAVKHSMQFTMCDVIEDESSQTSTNANNNISNEINGNELANNHNYYNDEEDDLKEDIILGISETDRLNADLIEDDNKEFQQFLEQINEE